MLVASRLATNRSYRQLRDDVAWFVRLMRAAATSTPRGEGELLADLVFYEKAQGLETQDQGELAGVFVNELLEAFKGARGVETGRFAMVANLVVHQQSLRERNFECWQTPGSRENEEVSRCVTVATWLREERFPNDLDRAVAAVLQVWSDALVAEFGDQGVELYRRVTLPSDFVESLPAASASAQRLLPQRALSAWSTDLQFARGWQANHGGGTPVLLHGWFPSGCLRVGLWTEGEIVVSPVELVPHLSTIPAPPAGDWILRSWERI